MILRSIGDAVEGEKLVAVGRRVSKPIIIPATARHRAQQVYIYGTPAKCYIDKAVRLLKK
jgi:hypothetical protein